MIKEFWDVYKKLPKDPEEFIIPFWKEKLKEIEEQFKPVPPAAYLRNPVVLWTMFVQLCEYSRIEYEYIKKHCINYTVLLSEVSIGEPQIINIEGILTSGNTIHHAYHLLRYIQKTKKDAILVDNETVFEWGGGYGNLARICKYLNTSVTYIIADTKFFSTLQYCHLCDVLGKDNISLGNIEPGKICIIPIGSLNKIDFKADMFISTWAISESSKAAQDFLISKKICGADKILIGHQGTSSAFPFADNIKDLVDGDCYTEEIEHIKGNYYLFK